jgi:hypothetical protein
MEQLAARVTRARGLCCCQFHSHMDLLEEASKRGGDLKALRELALSPNGTDALTKRLQGLGISKMGQRLRVVEALKSTAERDLPSHQVDRPKADACVDEPANSKPPQPAADSRPAQPPQPGNSKPPRPDVSPRPSPPLRPTFIESNFRTRAEWEASAALPDDERAAAEASEAAKIATSNMELRYVGRTVVLHDLKGRPELNGKRGKAVRYDAASGRVGVSIRSVNAFGGVEHATLALQPANLSVVERAAEEEEEEEEEDGEVSWARFCRKLGLRHLSKIHWSLHEEKLATLLMGQPADIDGAMGVLEREVGVTSPPERERIVHALLAPASTMGFGSTSISTMLKLFAARVAAHEKREQKAFEPDIKRRQASEKGVPTADSKYRDSPGRVCEQMRGRLDENDMARPPIDTSRSKIIIHPSPQQADALAGLLRTRCRMAACIGSGGPRLLEAMLERRGIDVMALDGARGPPFLTHLHPHTLIRTRTLIPSSAHSHPHPSPLIPSHLIPSYPHTLIPHPSHPHPSSPHPSPRS